MIDDRLDYLVTEIARGQISREDFRREFGSDEKGKSVSLGLLKEAFEKKDKSDMYYGLSLGYIYGFSMAYKEILRSLFYEDWHQQHEDIIFALDRLRDPELVDVFFDATRIVPSYLEWDDNRALAVKGIYALGKLGTDAAVERLNEIFLSDDPALKKAVLIQFERILPPEKRSLLRNDDDSDQSSGS